MITALKRGIRSGWKLFQRNSAISISNIVIITIAIFLLLCFILLGKASQILVKKLEEKADLSVYFKAEVPEEEILKLKDEISRLEGVDKIEYTSKEEALKRFTERHKQNKTIMEAIKEVGNPFLSSLSIKTRGSSYIEKVLSYLENAKDKIKEKDYFERKLAIEKIFSISHNIRRALLFLTIFFAFVSLLFVFTAIHLSLISYREEIAIQKLVGASNWTIRFPFIFQGIITGIISTFIAIFLIVILTISISGKLNIFSPDLRLVEVMKNNFFLLLFSGALFGIFLGLFSSLMALRKYIRI